MSIKTPPSQAAAAKKSEIRHSLFEDVQALLTATLIIALGVVMYKTTGLLTGGVTGLAFLAHYASGLNFGLLLVGINLPFYAFSLKRMGLKFTLKSLTAVSLVALFTELSPGVIRFEWLHPVFAALIGGLLIGVGMIILFRHKASLGGLNIVVLYLQEKYGWRAGKLQMVFDCAIVLGSAFFVPLSLIAVSVLGAIVLNLSLVTNHKPGRYLTP
jgi:uncharacterized membrane-anchored protein YitT (DUF2179 family)